MRRARDRVLHPRVVTGLLFDRTVSVRSWATSALVGLCILFAHEPAALAQPTPSVLFPLRSIHASGNWGTNELIVAWWEADRARPLVPADYIEWLERLHVNLIGLSVELTYQDSTDSTVERAPNSFSDDVLRQFIREFKAHDIQVYLTLALNDYEAGMSSRPAPRWLLGDHQACCGALQEYWPWDPEHPDHERFVAQFWDTYARQAVHLARIAEAEGVRLYSLGTETDRLFRTRSGGGYFINDFGQELRSMVDRVRAVYSGLLTYDMHYDVVRSPDFYGPGLEYLWRDLDLDVVGVSAWFPITDHRPSAVTTRETVRARYEQIFRDYLIPLSARNPGRPIVFLEYGAMDMVETPGAPDDPAGYPPFVFTDANGNGLDDGRETQGNMYQALVDTMENHPGVLNGVFWWDNWIAGDELWGEYWAGRRAFAIRDKPTEGIVRSAYARTANDGPPEMVGVIPKQSVTVGQALRRLINVTPYFRDWENDGLTYSARSSDASVVQVGVTGAVLEITAAGVGDATVAVTASNRGGWATQIVQVVSCASVATCSAPPAGFTDDPIRPGSTLVKAVHFLELRSRIDSLRSREGLRFFAWTDPTLTPGVTAVRHVHLTELRTALSAAYVAAGLAPPAYEDVVVRAGSTVIRAGHLIELRAAVRDLEAFPG